MKRSPPFISTPMVGMLECAAPTGRQLPSTMSVMRPKRSERRHEEFVVAERKVGKERPTPTIPTRNQEGRGAFSTMMNQRMKTSSHRELMPLASMLELIRNQFRLRMSLNTLLQFVLHTRSRDSPSLLSSKGEEASALFVPSLRMPSKCTRW